MQWLLQARNEKKNLIDSLSECHINVPSNLGPKIGEGNMGSVYHYIHDGTEVAVKTFKVNVSNEKLYILPNSCKK